MEIVNHTGVIITGLYISNSGTGGYAGSNFAYGGIAHRGRRNVNVPSNAPRYIKMKIVLAEGKTFYWDRIDLSSVRRITFVTNGSKIRAEWN